jgi:release factor glutamine methyltransferase
MKNSKTLFNDFVKQITLNESAEEISSMAYLVFENVFGLKRTDVLSGKTIDLLSSDENKLLAIADRINQHEPIQYILGEADFFGRKFLVNTSVLIPRPETEELVRLIIDYSKKKNILKILDIGTGSGCIPVTLALEIPGSEVYATDVSKEALAVAEQNAKRNGTRVKFIYSDILRESIPVEGLDIIVSNPPYIAKREMQDMRQNVIDFEPHLALFVPNDDPLLFYRRIISKSRSVLNKEGLLAFEINERFGKDVADLFLTSGFKEVQVVKDLSGKDRIAKGILREP